MFLDRIIESTKARVARQMEAVPLEQVQANVTPLQGFPFEKALRQSDIAFICEAKKASPSKGIIAADFPYLQIAKDYQSAGAAAISVLTEPEYFLGSDKYLREISESVTIPTLRKDFIVDAYQIYEARTLGVAAVLLIAEVLDEDKLGEYIATASSIGLSALVECHSLPQLQKALRAGANIIGINNRNLETFEVDIATTIKLREHIPTEKICVSESGISTAAEITLLRQHNINAALIGESLMRSSDKAAHLAQLRGIV